MAASTLYWTGGANNGTFSDANNWNTARDGSGSALAPGAGGAGDTLYVEQTSQTINGADTGISILNMFVSFAGNIGTAAAPLRFTCTGTVTIASSGGTHYIAATSAATIANVAIRSTGVGKVWLSGPGAITTITVGESCQFDIASNTAVTSLFCASGVGDVAANGTAITTLTAGRSASITTYRGVTTLENEGTVKTLGNAAAITTAKTFGGGFLQHYSSSTITTSDVRSGGTATAKGSPNNATVTNRTTYQGGKNFIDSSNVTFTNTATVIGNTT